LPKPNCYDYTIYPFPNHPSDPINSEVGLYLHATNKEPTCEEDVINYEIKRDNFEIVIKLKDGSSSRDCTLKYLGAGPKIPSARIILGYLPSGSYTIHINTCRDTDEYILEIENGKYNLISTKTTHGLVLPVNREDYLKDPTYCEQDSDCILQPIGCNHCACPSIINKYNFKKYDCPPSENSPACEPCIRILDFQLKCENNKCTGYENGRNWLGLK